MSVAEIDLTVPGEALYDSFDLLVREKDAREWEFRKSTRATRESLDFPDYGDFEIAIVPLVNGVPAAPDQWTVLPFSPEDLSDFVTPSTVANFAAAQDHTVIRCRWDAVVDTPHLDHYEIRFGSSWEMALVIAHVPAGVTEASFAPWATGSTTFYIKARTAQGLESATAASSTVLIQADEYGPVQGTHNEHGGGYSGTKADVEVNSGDLRQALLPATCDAWSAGVVDDYSTGGSWGIVKSGGTYVTAAQDVGSVVQERVEVAVTPALTKQATVCDDWDTTERPDIDGLGNSIHPGTRSPYSYVNSDETIHDGLELRVEIDTAQDGVPTWDGWRRWVPGAVYTYRQVRLRFTFVCPWPWAYLKTTAMTWYRRRENRKAEGEATVSGTGGTTITFPSGRFTAAPQLSGAVIHASTPHFPTFSNVTATECKVRIWDTAGAEVASGSVHWHALGV